MGLDGFIMNIGDPRQTFVRASLDFMFDYLKARDNFKLWISMDLWAAGDTKPKQGAFDFIPVLQDYINLPAYQRSPDNLPMVTTFADGATHNDTWSDWRKQLGTEVFFMPVFDKTEGYYDADPGWWAYWGDVLDGLASWESAWPFRAGYGGAYAGDVGPDEKPCRGAANHSKPYMIPLSPLQYKNAYHTNIYRAGDINLPLRIVNILDMDPSPEYVHVLTWNDGPESHYIGNLWSEQNNSTDPGRYATQKYVPHDGWQGIIASFIQAFKAERKAADMTPINGDEFTGAMWYKTILQNATCPWDGAGEYFVRPDGFSDGDDALSFAAIVPNTGTYWVELYSGGEQIFRAELHAGLNYGTLPGLRPGFQRMHIVDSAGTTKRVAAGGQCVSSGCPDCIYNMNPQVVPLSDNTEDNGRCPETKCGGVDVYVPGSVWTGDSAADQVIQCIPPCTLILPPYQLPSATTISWPVLTTTMWWLSSGSTVTKLTSLTVPAITTTEIQFWPVTAGTADTARATLSPIPRVMPPWMTVTLPPGVATFAPTPVGNSSQPPPTFYSTSHTVTVQPQPTVTITPLPLIPSLTYTSAEPTTTCTDHCGGYECELFGCLQDDEDEGDDEGGEEDGDDGSKQKCGLFACDGGCSTVGCGIRCGPFGCSSLCPLSICGGLGCRSGSCGSSGGGGGGSDPDNSPSSSTSPCTTQTATACTTACVGAASSSCSTVCETRTACTATATGTQLWGTPAPGAELEWDIWTGDEEVEGEFAAAADVFASYLSAYWSTWTATHVASTTTTAAQPTAIAAPREYSFVKIALNELAVETGATSYVWYIWKGGFRGSDDGVQVCRDDPDQMEEAGLEEPEWPDDTWDLGTVDGIKESVDINQNNVTVGGSDLT
ncbi:putative glycoside hydrolase family 71 [Diplodia seriata]|uniref:Putative glycoside hydrolase family 71 n=1 Tax=Diplodia seriata TaxID=420778 RepID=A0A0G2F0T1_9PEZI|nr:putative glycoside hydrolase family 71 [Diplodia seriata]